MIGRRAVIGLSLLSALLFCAFAAQSASAAKSIKTTAFTCVDTFPNNTGDFKDPHCDKEGTTGAERYEHIGIPNNTTTAVYADNQAVTGETKKSEPAVLTGAIGLTKTEVTCTSVENDISEDPVTKAPRSNIHNVVTEVDKVKHHTMTGSVKTKYTGCTVQKPEKCSVKEPIEANATYEGVEGLGAGANEMGVEFKGSGAEETFAELTYTGESCALKNQTFKIKGSVVATSGPGTEEAT